MKAIIKKLVINALNSIGLDMVRIKNSPKHTLLGLRNLPIRSIIDIGANEGQFARNILKFFPNADIYCFEPLPEAFEKLKRWMESQNERGKVFNVALGDDEGIFEMFYHLEHNSSSSMLKTTEVCEALYPLTEKQTSISVKLTTMDNLSDSLLKPLEPEILIKLDVQGYEDRVIKGGTKTFHRARACILEVCLDKLYENQAAFKDILLLLYDLGFHYVGNLEQVYADDGHVIFIDAVFVK